MKTIAVCAGKGGTGKTFASLSLGVELTLAGKRAKRNAKVLLVDLDPSNNGSKIKSNSTGLSRLATAPEEPVTLAHLFQEAKLDPHTAVYPAGPDFVGISVMIAGDALEYVDRLVAKRHNTDLILKNILSKLSADFDYAILDCPPNRGLLAANAIAACDAFITPLDLDVNAIDGALAMRRLVEDLASEGVISKRPIDLGAFWSRYTTKDSHARRKITQLAEEVLEKCLLDIAVPESTHVKEAIYSTTTLQFDESHKVSKAYRDLTKHIKSRFNPRETNT